jgi:hypothetical protein
VALHYLGIVNETPGSHPLNNMPVIWIIAEIETPMNWKRRESAMLEGLL